jgi:pimeloyl-ACP methyl ester carboxylesterase
MSGSYCVDMGTFDAPKCFISGALDTLSPPELLRQYAGTLPDPKRLHVIPEADHLLSGHEQTVANLIVDFLKGG